MQKYKPSKQNEILNPVVIVTLGVILIAIAMVMIFNPATFGNLTNNNASLSTQIFITFITGLTTGGLSCLAVQGGLLASSLAHQIEQDVALKTTKTKKEKVTPKFNAAFPIFLFLLAKLIAYTLLGALLGWLGSYFTFNPTTRAALLIFIGIFMVGNALRMFNVHPIFRYFSIQPPKFITRMIRKTAKGADTATPIFLGALTVFIPCGITQTIMAAALSTGNIAIGAALMFAFTLGTSPVFFAVAYLTTELGAKLEKFFMQFVAVVVLILGFMTLNGGLNIMGSPYSLQNLTRAWFSTPTDSPPLLVEAFSSSSQFAANVPSQPTAENEITLYVQNQGYFPATLKAPANKDIKLNLVTNGVYSCASSFIIPDLGFYQMLPPIGTTQVDIPAQSAGSILYFTCSMGMYTGQIEFQ
jgi:sulfite exporter TauE/SafE